MGLVSHIGWGTENMNIKTKTELELEVNAYPTKVYPDCKVWLGLVVCDN